MSMHRFVFTAIPTAAAKNAGDIAGANVDVWILEESAASAEAKARAHIMDYSWIVESIVSAEEIPDELCPDPDKQPELFALYRKALRQGIASLFSAWPKIPRPGVYEYRPMGEPPKSGEG